MLLPAGTNLKVRSKSERFWLLYRGAPMATVCACVQVTGVLPKSADGLTIVTLADDEDAPPMVL